MQATFRRRRVETNIARSRAVRLARLMAAARAIPVETDEDEKAWRR